MARILITGANGQVGLAFRRLARTHSMHEWQFLGYQELDITDATAVEKHLTRQPIDYLINCAAYTAVDRAEKEVEQAFRINEAGPALLSAACLRSGIHFFHYSTDYVYGDAYNTPIAETAATDPLGVYAASKLAGDAAIATSHTILRTSWVYGLRGHNFVHTMLRLGQERDTISVVYDQIGTPTRAVDLAKATLQMIDAVASGQVDRAALAGIFHYSHAGVASWYDFATAIMELAALDCRVLPIRSADYPTAAPRPPYSVLDKQKLQTIFGVTPPHWRMALAEFLAEWSGDDGEVRE